MRMVPVSINNMAYLETFDLPATSYGGIFFGTAYSSGGHYCRAICHVHADGSLQLDGDYMQNWTYTDSGSYMAIYDNGSNAQLKNRNSSYTMDVFGVFLYY